MEKIWIFWRDESGAGSAEYSYWVAVISMGTIGIVSLLGIITGAEWAVGPDDLSSQS
jgi:Flp pilus assembly pilin Flp